MKKIVLFGALAILCGTFTGCHHHDPEFWMTEPPTVEVAPNTLSGLITNMQGNAVAGATVTFGNETAVTDAEGIYSFSEVKEGKYTISVAADGMVGVTDEITVEKSSTTLHLVWNATMAKINTTDVNVTVDGGGEGTVESEALEDNEEGKVDITVTVPADVVPENTTISITPIYTEESAAAIRSTRADNEEMLIGANLACSDQSLVLTQDVDLKFALDNTVATSVVTKKLINGQWVDAPSAVVDGNVVISAREFTSYGIFLKVNVSEKTSTEPLTFVRSEWNNTFGASNIQVDKAEFTYKLGSQISSKATNKLEGLLIEFLSRLSGASMKTVEGTYPINVMLPIGMRLTVTGAQEKTDVTVSGNGKSVTGTEYGTVNVKTSISGQEHNAGTN